MKLISSIFLIFTLLLSSCSTTAQGSMYDSKNKKAIGFYKKAYEVFRTSYGNKEKLAEAEKYAQKAVKKDPKFATAIFLLGEIEVAKGNLEKAIEYKEQALRVNPEYSKHEYFYLARMQLLAGQYDKCRANSQKYVNFSNVNTSFQLRCKQMIKNCDFAKSAIANPVDFNPVNLGEAINTSDPEYFPTFTGDGNSILFTRVIKDKNARNRSGKQENFYTSTKTNGDWQKAKSMTSTINTYFNEGAPTLSADGNFLIFTSCIGMDGTYGASRTGKGSCDLFYAQRIGNKWSKPKNLGAKINTKHWESQPCFSADGRTLYFIRAIRENRGRTNPENQDIYVTKLQDNGYWTTPKKLSNTINTPRREESVFIHPDGQTLYFGSNGHTGMGGMDLYFSRLQPNGEWGKPVNLGYPINTHKNENSIIVSPDGELAYFASDRESGFGGLDLYSFELPEKVRPIYTTYMKGVVYDEETKQKLRATFQIIDLETKKVLINSSSDPVNGSFLVNIPTNKKLAINVAREGYFFYSQNFSIADSKEPQLLDIPLNKIKVSDKPFVLENIFFDVNKFNLRPESRIELDKLFELLKKNKTLTIEIGGHTDSDGNAGKNQELSEKRAKAVANYLKMKGIEITRLKFKGYGATVPRAANDSDKNKALNRRTEVKIIGL